MSATLRRNVAIAAPALGDEEWQALRGPILSGWLTQGKEVAAFEAAFAQRHGVARAVATTSCTTALHLMLAALGIGPGDEVIVPSFTWVATANAVAYCGATPVLADIDSRTFNLEPVEVTRRLTPRTRAILAVHLFGLCADIDAIRAVAPGVPILEDAACATGASYKGRCAGSLGVLGAFSFHPRKAVTTGEGGMVTTDDLGLAEKISRLRNHGASVSEEERHTGPRPYLLPDFAVVGFNYRMTDLQAAVGRVQLAKLDSFIAERQRWAELYRKGLSGLSWLRVPEVPEGYTHAWQSYVCWVDPALAPCPRNAIMEELQAQGVGTRPGTHAVHLLGAYCRPSGRPAEALPVSRAAAEQSLALPMHNRLEPADVEYVVERLHAIR